MLTSGPFKLPGRLLPADCCSLPCLETECRERKEEDIDWIQPQLKREFTPSNRVPSNRARALWPDCRSTTLAISSNQQGLCVGTQGRGLEEANGNEQLGACAQSLRLLCTQSVTRAHGHNQAAEGSYWRMCCCAI